MKKTYSYDEKCEDLVRHFLQDKIYKNVSEETIKDLAQHIQVEIETWIVNEIDMKQEK